MPTPRKLNIMFAFPSYGGNGGISSEVPDIRKWYVETVLECQKDDRIGEVHEITLAETPITMSRNRFVQAARQKGCDILVMCDSDQNPNLHAKEQGFAPFFKSSFDHLYKHYDQGPVVIGAPYCGPPPYENVYVFRWDSQGVYGTETQFSLEQYSRHEASKMQGIQECAALPTGLIMYDMRCFELIEPAKMSQRRVLEELEAHRISVTDAMRNLSQGWFYYEWKDQTACEKASTEDVTNTRDISLAGMAKLDYNPVLCNWDSPIGHWKPWCVPGRPKFFGVESIAQSFKRAVQDDTSELDRIIDVQLPDRFKHLPVNRVAPEKTNGHVEVINGHKTFIAEGHKTPDSQLAALRKFIGIEWNRRDKASGRPNYLKVLEVGTWHGDSAKAMAADELAQVMCVDTWEGTEEDYTGEEVRNGHDPFREFLNRTTNERDMRVIKYLKKPSLEAAHYFDNEGADVILYDADHSYEATKANIEAYWPKLHPHGVMIIHDYRTQNFPGVTQAIEECFESHAINPLGFEGLGWGYAVIRKSATAYSPTEVARV